MISVTNTIDTGHEDMIHDAQLDYYGQRLATCSSDNSIKIYDIKNNTQSLVADLKGHFGPVWQISWSHPKHGNLLASCSYDRKVIIWKETREWTKMYEYTGHESSVNSVDWAPEEYGLILACGSSDGSISTLTYNQDGGNWEAKKITGAHAIGVNAVSWCSSISPDMSLDPLVNKSASKRLVSGGCDNLVKIWKEQGDQWVEENKLEMHTDWVRDVAWAPSFGLQKSMIASCSQDKRVVIWTSDDNISWTPTILNTFDDAVWSLSWSPTGTILAVSGGDNKVSLWKEGAEGQWLCISEVAKDALKSPKQERAFLQAKAVKTSKPAKPINNTDTTKAIDVAISIDTIKNIDMTKNIDSTKTIDATENIDTTKTIDATKNIDMTNTIDATTNDVTQSSKNADEMKTTDTTKTIEPTESINEQTG